MANTIVDVKGKEKMRGHLALLFANTAWGLMAPISKGLLNLGVISQLPLSGVRIMGGALLFWLASALTPDSVIKKERIEPGDYIKIFFAGLLVIAANQILVVQGMSYTSPVDAAVVCSTTPIFTLILATIILKERLTSFRMGGVALGFAAVVVFSLWGEADVTMTTEDRSLPGDRRLSFLASAIAKSGMTQEAVAKAVGLRRTAIQHWLNEVDDCLVSQVYETAEVIGMKVKINIEPK